MGRTTTIKDVAREVGVHPSTISRALDPVHRGRIGDALVRRIEEAAERLGYRPDRVAASLRNGRSNMIGIVVPDIANPVFSPIISGLGYTLSLRGYALVLADQQPQQTINKDIIEKLISRRVDGLVLANAKLQDDAVERCLQWKIPVVLVNRTEAHPRVPSVVSDDIAGMRLAVGHLLELGHRAILHLAGPQGVSTGALRRRGFIEAMMSAGLDPSDADVEEAEAFTRDAGKSAALRLLARRPQATAVVAANDLLALGVYEALKDLGKRCPEDLSVIGHNDMPLVDLVEPPLSTIRISHSAMGEQAGTLLLDMIEGVHQETLQIVTPPLLVKRRSTRPLSQSRAALLLSESPSSS